MKTLSDIAALGEQAAEAGAPLVKNWPQVRACLHLVDHAVGLHEVRIADFPMVFPEDFDSLGDEVQRAFPSRRSYDIAAARSPGCWPSRAMSMIRGRHCAC